jgi:nitrite reductase (NADH) small subunit
MTWMQVANLEQLPSLGARVLRADGTRIALFRTADDRVFAVEDRCPHRGGPLSQGIVHGTCVTCPLHDWVIDLTTGAATGADEGRTRTFSARVVDGAVYLRNAECGDAGLRAPLAGESQASHRAGAAGE